MQEKRETHDAARGRKYVDIYTSRYKWRNQWGYLGYLEDRKT